MSDIENPYQSPESQIVPETSQSSGILSVTMLKYLSEASPWLQFVGVLCYISCGMISLTGIVMMFTGSFFSDELGFPGFILGLIYLPLGLLYFFPARFIFNFGRKIRIYKLTNSTEDLELAFKNNKSLWKFIGIICIIGLSIIPVFFVVAIVIGVAAVL